MEAWASMHGTKGREESVPRGQQGVLPIRVLNGFSSPLLDQTDREILSLIRSRPMTILNVAEKMDTPFVECLARTRKLWRLKLLERIEAEPGEIGLHRYSSVVKEDWSDQTSG
ncbi:MAG: hypothetical protein KAR39_07035 [Thermoplasmata archaeon]|nr:hypothetical protein [Thermoplasmata archaeon]